MKQRDMAIIAIFTLVTVITWIVLTLYHANVTSTISSALQEKIEPISPQFNMATVDMLKKDRKKLEMLTEIVASGTPIPKLIPQEETTQSATQGGSL